MKINRILFLQGIYYSLTAIWPLIHMESFLLLTGFKYDTWLVKTVGIMLLCSGISFCIAGKQSGENLPILFLAIAEALGLAYVDVYYTRNDTISSIYLADAFAEVLIVIGLISGIYKNNHSSKTSE